MLLTSMPLLHTIPFTDSLVRSPPTPAQDTPSLNQLFLPTNLPIPSSSSSISVTKPVPPPPPPPPPPSLPRKQDATSHTLRIVNPPKESCFEYVLSLRCSTSTQAFLSLPIMFPSIPKGGTKSRVETQIRVTVDLADANSSGPHKYNCVGSWKWLKLPPGTFTKRRTRKQGKIGASAVILIFKPVAHSTCRCKPPRYS